MQHFASRTPKVAFEVRKKKEEYIWTINRVARALSEGINFSHCNKRIHTSRV